MKYITSLIKALTLFIMTVLITSESRTQNMSSGYTFKVRAFYVDCRTQVMKMSAIKALASDLSKKGINTLVIEYEATFPFQQHATLCNEYAYTEAEVKDLVSHCTQLGIDIIPLQYCFGHSEYILRHNRYAHLREDNKEISQVCPLKINEAKKVFGEIFREVARLHPSKYFHIGADETYLLGHCEKCSAIAANEGKSRLFVDYIKAMSAIVLEMGKTPIIWADIILMYPEAVHELPKELIFVDWNYGWEPDHFGKLENLFTTGAEIWGASSLRSGPDNVYLTQWEKHFNNLSIFIPFAREKNFQGMIQTSWSTSGIYGFHYDNDWEILSMQPIRNVYPMSAFNVLIDAYCTAVNFTKPLDGHQFVIDYAQTRYGLNKAEGEILWEYFIMPQEVITRQRVDMKGTPIAAVLDNCVRLRDKFNKLNPKKNKEEFEHYRLMLDLRINHVAFRKVEYAFESSSYNRSQAARLLNELRPLIDEADKLDRRFVELNKDYLKEDQLEYINFIRNEKMKAMCRWLKNNQ